MVRTKPALSTLISFQACHVLKPISLKAFENKPKLKKASSDITQQSDMLKAWVKWLRMQGHCLPATLEVTGSNPGTGKINLNKIEKHQRDS